MKIGAEFFFDQIAIALHSKVPFTAYNKPDSDEIKAFYQKNAELKRTKDYSESGFVFVPFNNKKASILFPFKESVIYTTNFADVHNINTITNNKPESRSVKARTTHINLVKRGIDFLRESDVKKVVLSRKEILTFSHFNILEIFKKLLISYRNAMVYVWFHPKVGLWLGATPETLLKVADGQFETMALAGTQIYKGSLNVVWEKKEKQEQQYVTDFIIKRIAKNSVKTDISKPKTVRAGNVLHLCTSIKGQLTHKLTLKKLLKLLHPTPAVCGLPKKASKSFILKNEAYDREFYTGFFGELNLKGSSNLFVNLRCMQVIKNQVSIYVGGGITIDSIPEKEWEETEVKSEVLLKVLA